MNTATTTTTTTNDIAEDGLVWFRLVPGGKRPAIHGWTIDPHCQHGAPPDVGFYGLRTGRANGWWVLDLDVKAATDRAPAKDGYASLRAYCAKHGHEWPATFVLRTPSGGAHLYFQYDATRPIGTGTNLLPGVDWRGDGGYVRTGRTADAAYEQHPDFPDMDPQPAPEWLVEFIEGKTVKVSNEVTGQPRGEFIDPTSPEGQEQERRALAMLRRHKPLVAGAGTANDQMIGIVGDLVAICGFAPTEAWRIFVASGLNDKSIDSDGNAYPWSEQEFTRIANRVAVGALKPDLQWGIGLAPDGWKLEPPKTTANDDADFRQHRNPDHAYTVDVTHTAIGEKQALDQAALNNLFSGRSASPDWCGVFQFDTFYKAIVAVNPPMRLDAEQGRLTQKDLAKVQHWLLTRGYKATKEAIETAITVAADLAESHAVRDYLASLPKATTNHLATFGQEFFGSSDVRASEYVRKWMIGCVARVMSPGCQFDTALILVGEHGGEKKSSFFAALAVNEDWYRPSLPDIKNQTKTGMAMRGHWIVELAELATMRHSDQEAFKSFVTQRAEKFDEKYERHEAREPRQCGIAATTNTKEFLSSLEEATARRFLPIEVLKRIDIPWLREHRDELWAEARDAYEAGEPWHIENERDLDESKAEFIAATPEEEKLLAFLADPARRPTIAGKSATEIAQMVLGIQGTPATWQRDMMAKLLKKQPGVVAQRKTNRRWYDIE